MVPIMVLQRPRPAGNHVISGSNLTLLPVNPYVGMQTGASLTRTSHPNANVLAGTGQVGIKANLAVSGRAEVTVLNSCLLGLAVRTLGSSPGWAIRWMCDLRGITHNPGPREEPSSWTIPPGCGHQPASHSSLPPWQPAQEQVQSGDSVNAGWKVEVVV